MPTHPFEGLPQCVIAMIMRLVHDRGPTCFVLRLVSRGTREITAPLYKAVLRDARPLIVAPSYTWYQRATPGVSARSLGNVRRILTSDGESLTIALFCRAFWREVASVTPTVGDIAEIGTHLASYPDDAVELELRADFMQARRKKDALEFRALAALRPSIRRARVCYLPPRKWQLELMRKILPETLRSLALRECRLTNSAALHDLLLCVPRLECLDLFGNAGLAFPPLATALSRMTSMRNLSIGKLADVGADALAAVLESMPLLSTLNVRACLSRTTARLARELRRVRSLDASWCDLDLDILDHACALETLDLSGNAAMFAHRAGVDPYATFGAAVRAMPNLADLRLHDTNVDARLLIACMRELRRPIHCRLRAPAGAVPAVEGLVRVTWTYF